MRPARIMAGHKTRSEGTGNVTGGEWTAGTGNRMGERGMRRDGTGTVMEML